ncbi:MAG TPA: TerD family protein [Iamia sp.]|nr:TerD family protein [Iamia sp.]
MATEFSRGQKSPLSNLTPGTDLYVGVKIDGPGSWDISCFGLDEADKLSDDSYFIFFNQPKSPEESIQQLGAQSGDTESFRLTLDKVPDKIRKLSICAASEDATAGQITSGWFRIVVGGEEVAKFSFSGADFAGERAVIIGDVYMKSVWRVAAVGQGFAGGLADLIRSYGGEVADDEPAAAPPPANTGFAPPPGGPAPAPGFAPPPGGPAPAPPPQQAPPQFGAPAGGPAPAPPQQAPAAGGAIDLTKVPAGGYADTPTQYQPTPPGAMVSLEKYKEKPTTGRYTQQSSKMIKVTLGAEVLTRKGSMVAYQGNIEFDHKGSGGLKKMLENKMTGQGLSMMICKGEGEVFLAEDATDLHIVELNGRTININANNVLCMDATLSVETKRMESAGLPGGGFFHIEVTGQGTIVVMTHGTPMTIPVAGPTSTDVNATVAWSAGMRVSVSNQVRVQRNLYAGQSAEAGCLDFMGMGEAFVVVQPYEV